MNKKYLHVSLALIAVVILGTIIYKNIQKDKTDSNLFDTRELSDAYLPLPKNFPYSHPSYGWYPHRLSDTSFIITKEKTLPDISGKESSAYGEHTSVSMTTTILSPWEWAKQQPWFNDTDISSSAWSAVSDHTLLSRKTRDQMTTHYLFVGKRVYTITYYPFPFPSNGSKGIEIYSHLTNNYASDPAYKIIYEDNPGFFFKEPNDKYNADMCKEYTRIVLGTEPVPVIENIKMDMAIALNYIRDFCPKAPFIDLNSYTTTFDCRDIILYQGDGEDVSGIGLFLDQEQDIAINPDTKTFSIGLPENLYGYRKRLEVSYAKPSDYANCSEDVKRVIEHR